MQNATYKLQNDIGEIILCLCYLFNLLPYSKRVVGDKVKRKEHDFIVLFLFIKYTEIA